MTAQRDRKRSVTTASTAKRRILLVDDHPIVRDGLRQLINAETDLCVCGEAGDVPTAWAALEATKPDLVMLDISLSDTSGIELLKSIRERHFSLAIVMLSMHDERLYAERCLRAGANGYLMKQESSTSVLTAIRTVLAGDVFVSASVASRIMRTLVTQRKPDVSALDALSDREIEVLELVGKAASTRDIARKLNLSIKTVETHKSNLKRKLSLETAAELTRYAVQWTESGS